MDTEAISRYFDREIASCCAAGTDPGAELSPVSRILFERLTDVGVRNRSVLELGTGGGALSLALLDAGAAQVTGFDVSAASVRLATERASAAGVSERAPFRTGDAAEVTLPLADVVVLDKVFCCYPDVEALRTRSIAAARSIFAMALPASTGLRGMLARVTIAAENLWRRITGDPFRAFVHDVPAIERELHVSGFERVAVGRRRAVWFVVVFARPA